MCIECRLEDGTEIRTVGELRDAIGAILLHDGSVGTDGQCLCGVFVPESCELAGWEAFFADVVDEAFQIYTLRKLEE